MRCGTVAIVGRTNVGKSTFLNACLGERIAIVSPLPQTTRDELLGVVHRPTAQIAFTDTPGFHRPKTELGRRMNQAALDTVRSHEAVVFMTDVGRVTSRRIRPTRTGSTEETDLLHPDDRRLLKVLPPNVPTVLVVNKVDLLRDKSRLLPFMAAFNEAHPFVATIPTSMLKADGVERVLDEIEAHLPEGNTRFDDDALTDKPATFFVREYIREQVMLVTQREVPHAIAVTVERFEEGQKLIRIQATLHVEKTGQRIIIVGRGGEGIKGIGTKARERLEELLGKRIHLELFVRVTERWKDMPRQLRELGYETGGGRDLSNVLPKIATPRKKELKKKPDKKAARAPSTKKSQGKAGAPRSSAKDGERTRGARGADKARTGGGRAGSSKPARSKKKGGGKRPAHKKTPSARRSS